MDQTQADILDPRSQDIAFNPAPRVSAMVVEPPDRARTPVLAGFFLYLLFAALAGLVIWRLAPDQITLRLAGRTIVLHELHRRLLSTWFVFAGMIPAIMLAELATGGWRESSLRLLTVKQSASIMSDVVIFLCQQARVMTIFGMLLTFGAVMVSGGFLHQKLVQATGVSFSAEVLPFAVQAIMFAAIYTFLDYWNHRLNHSRYFWPLHRYHHSAGDFCILTSTRTHPAAYTDVVFTNLPAVLLAMSPEVIVVMNLFFVTLRYVIHSRIDSDFGWVGRWVVQSPVHHRLHHVLDTTEPTANFGLTPVWDRLFGTWSNKGDQRLVIGVDTPYRHGAWFLPDMWRDYRDFWTGLFQLVRPGAARAEPAP